MTRRWAATTIVAFASVAATTGCRSRALQPDAGGTGVLPTGGGGASGLGPGIGGGELFDGAARADGLVAGDGTPRDIPARPDGEPPFMGNLSEQDQCHALPNTAPYIGPIGHGNEPRPLSGGTIRDGIYELIQADYYIGGDSGLTFPYIHRRTIQFQQNATHWQIADFVPQSSIAAVDTRPSVTVTFVTDSNTLRTTLDSCYSNAGAVDEYQYEATPETVMLWNERTRGMLLYLRAP